MKISILCPNLSGNALGRAYLLAMILQSRFQVEILGPLLGEDIWFPLRDTRDVSITALPYNCSPLSVFHLKKNLARIDGDIIYASKPFLTSTGYGLLKKLLSSRPLVVDIDDWEMGFLRTAMKKTSPINRLKYFIRSAMNPEAMNSYFNVLFSEKLSRFANTVTVSNSFLQKRFGGIIIWHGRDAGSFSPEKFDNLEIRSRLGIDPDLQLVVFFGTPQEHKGVDDLIRAVGLIQDPDLCLLLVGLNERDAYSRTIRTMGQEALGSRFIYYGLQPFELVPQFLAIADVVAIAQKAGTSTLGQMPAKVFDAMALARPIVATAVSDLPSVLDGCGWIVEPGSPEQLAQAIREATANKSLAMALGEKARLRFEENYSWEAVGEKLIPIFEAISGKI